MSTSELQMSFMNFRDGDLAELKREGITTRKVQMIMEDFIDERFERKDLSSKYGLKLRTIDRILTKQIWTWVKHDLKDFDNRRLMRLKSVGVATKVVEQVKRPNGRRKKCVFLTPKQRIDVYNTRTMDHIQLNVLAEIYDVSLATIKNIINEFKEK